MSLQHLNLLITNVMNKYNVNGFSIDKEGSCTIVFPDNRLPNINFYYDDDSDSVLIFAEVGYLITDKESMMMRRLLEKNLFGIGAQGCVFAITKETGAVILQLRLDVEILTVNGLENALGNFIEVLDQTRKELFDDTIPVNDTKQDDSEFSNLAFQNYIYR